MSESNVELPRSVKKKHKKKTMPNPETKQYDQDSTISAVSPAGKDSMISSIAALSEPSISLNDNRLPREWFRNVVLSDSMLKEIDGAVQVEEQEVEIDDKKKVKENLEAEIEENEDEIVAGLVDTEKSEKKKKRNKKKDKKSEESEGAIVVEDASMDTDISMKKRNEEVIAVVNCRDDLGVDESEKMKIRKCKLDEIGDVVEEPLVELEVEKKRKKKKKSKEDSDVIAGSMETEKENVDKIEAVVNGTDDAEADENEKNKNSGKTEEGNEDKIGAVLIDTEISKKKKNKEDSDFIAGSVETENSGKTEKENEEKNVAVSVDIEISEKKKRRKKRKKSEESEEKTAVVNGTDDAEANGNAKKKKEDSDIIAGSLDTENEDRIGAVLMDTEISKKKKKKKSEENIGIAVVNDGNDTGVDGSEKKHKKRTMPNPETKQSDQDSTISAVSPAVKDSMISSIAVLSEPSISLNDNRLPREWFRNVVLSDSMLKEIDGAVQVEEQEVEIDNKKKVKENIEDETEEKMKKENEDEIEAGLVDTEKSEKKKKRKKKDKMSEDDSMDTDISVKKRGDEVIPVVNGTDDSGVDESEKMNIRKCKLDEIGDGVEEPLVELEAEKKRKKKKNKEDSDVIAGSVETENSGKTEKENEEMNVDNIGAVSVKKKRKKSEKIAVVNGTDDAEADENEKNKNSGKTEKGNEDRIGAVLMDAEISKKKKKSEENEENIGIAVVNDGNDARVGGSEKKKKNKEGCDIIGGSLDTENSGKNEKENEDKIGAVLMDTEISKKKKKKKKSEENEENIGIAVVNENENEDKVGAVLMDTEISKKKKKKSEENIDIAVVNDGNDAGVDGSEKKHKKRTMPNPETKQSDQDSTISAVLPAGKDSMISSIAVLSEPSISLNDNRLPREWFRNVVLSDNMLKEIDGDVQVEEQEVEIDNKKKVKENLEEEIEEKKEKENEDEIEAGLVDTEKSEKKKKRKKKNKMSEDDSMDTDISVKKKRSEEVIPVVNGTYDSGVNESEKMKIRYEIGDDVEEPLVELEAEKKKKKKKNKEDSDVIAGSVETENSGKTEKENEEMNVDNFGAVSVKKKRKKSEKIAVVNGTDDVEAVENEKNKNSGKIEKGNEDKIGSVLMDTEMSKKKKKSEENEENIDIAVVNDGNDAGVDGSEKKKKKKKKKEGSDIIAGSLDTESSRKTENEVKIGAVLMDTEISKKKKKKSEESEEIIGIAVVNDGNDAGVDGNEKKKKNKEGSDIFAGSLDTENSGKTEKENEDKIGAVLVDTEISKKKKKKKKSEENGENIGNCYC